MGEAALWRQQASNPRQADLPVALSPITDDGVLDLESVGVACAEPSGSMAACGTIGPTSAHGPARAS